MSNNTTCDEIILKTQHSRDYENFCRITDFNMKQVNRKNNFFKAVNIDDYNGFLVQKKGVYSIDATIIAYPNVTSIVTLRLLVGQNKVFVPIGPTISKTFRKNNKDTISSSLVTKLAPNNVIALELRVKPLEDCVKNEVSFTVLSGSSLTARTQKVYLEKYAQNLFNDKIEKSKKKKHASSSSSSEKKKKTKKRKQSSSSSSSSSSSKHKSHHKSHRKAHHKSHHKAKVHRKNRRHGSHDNHDSHDTNHLAIAAPYSLEETCINGTCRKYECICIPHCDVDTACAIQRNFKLVRPMETECGKYDFRLLLDNPQPYAGLYYDFIEHKKAKHYQGSGNVVFKKLGKYLINGDMTFGVDYITDHVQSGDSIDLVLSKREAGCTELVELHKYRRFISQDNNCSKYNIKQINNCADIACDSPIVESFSGCKVNCKPDVSDKLVCCDKVKPVKCEDDRDLIRIYGGQTAFSRGVIITTEFAPSYCDIKSILDNLFIITPSPVPETIPPIIHNSFAAAIRGIVHAFINSPNLFSDLLLESLHFEWCNGKLTIPPQEINTDLSDTFFSSILGLTFDPTIFGEDFLELLLSNLDVSLKAEINKIIPICDGYVENKSGCCGTIEFIGPSKISTCSFTVALHIVISEFAFTINVGEQVYNISFAGLDILSEICLCNTIVSLLPRIIGIPDPIFPAPILITFQEYKLAINKHVSRNGKTYLSYSFSYLFDNCKEDTKLYFDIIPDSSISIMCIDDICTSSINIIKINCD